MTVISLIPYWLDYSAEQKAIAKNKKILAGHHLINYSINALNQIDSIDDVVIFASNDKVLDYIDDDCRYTFWKRPDYLDHMSVSIEDIISEFMKKAEADIIVLLHPNCPFLEAKTIADCISKVQSGKYDSAFTAYKYHKFSWHKGKPLNYSLEHSSTPRLSDIEPIIIEQGSLYVFTRESFQKKSRRIGEKVYIKEINHFEGHEVNEIEDFEIAELIINSGMYKGL